MGRSNRAALDAKIAEATADCYNDSECVTGFHTMFEDNLAFPFQTVVLGVDVTEDGQITAICVRGRPSSASRSGPAVATPPPEGAEWIDTYRRWLWGRDDARPG
ncbi:hypothetical protein JOF56_001974 [Kibdelosporangium banguiense]|uniref:Uncharacterized protein n=1 Tax=Kibdelosporangium banguiense TaxID=1365924 RepID=A0ABS4TB88_9PSEU|nr:hypothetical protein [Kibdelosporangium banguiense]MBP2321589.1 hypothetical protein [Kibdelosporangium banguiense]